MRLVATLSVEPSPGVLRFRLDVPERDAGEPLQEEVRHPLDEGTLRSLEESADALLRSAESPRFPDEARARGAVLYRTLVPPRLRARLKAVRGPLLVSTSLYGMPWELLHDDEEFWGLRYALGKRLVLDRPLPAVTSTGLRGRPRALVIGSDPRRDLPFVSQEVEAICDTLDPVAEVECVSARLATFAAVTAFLGRGFDLVHYCGHVVVDPDAGPSLLLADGRTLSASAIEANLTGRPLVFLNGCASARGEGRPATGAWEESFASVAYGFLFGGALGVVGTLADVSDRHAASLAAEFYDRALGREPVGEALRLARAVCRGRPESAASPTWLSVVLYGNPGLVLLGGGEVAETRARAPAVPVIDAIPLPWRGTRLRWVAFVLLVVALIAGLLQLRQPPPAAPVVVGVMAVRARGPNTPPWMREITRDGLNTILSKFPELRVFSRQKIDFVREKRQLTEIEAAEALGMSKMLSATVGADASLVTLELEVVDIPTGLLSASEAVRGPVDHFMELQTEFAVRTLHALGVVPNAERMRAIVASQNEATLDAYRMFKDTLGEPHAGGEGGAPKPTGRDPGASWFDGRAIAFAQEPDADETAIRTLLTQYGSALQAKSVDGLAGLQLEMSEGQRTSLERYFANAGELQVRISDVDVTVEGDEALATFTRQDVFVDGGTGRRMRLEVRISGILQKQQGAWKIRGLRDPA